MPLMNPSSKPANSRSFDLLCVYSVNPDFGICLTMVYPRSSTVHSGFHGAYPLFYYETPLMYGLRSLLTVLESDHVRMHKEFGRTWNLKVWSTIW